MALVMNSEDALRKLLSEWRVPPPTSQGQTLLEARILERIRSEGSQESWRRRLGLWIAVVLAFFVFFQMVRVVQTNFQSSHRSTVEMQGGADRASKGGESSWKS